MNAKFNKEDKLLILEITEEIDHHTTEKIRRKADYEIERFSPKRTIFDFNKVTFMDSAGIGMLIGRYKLVTMLGGTMEMVHVKPNIRKIFEMCGIPKIMKVG